MSLGWGLRGFIGGGPLGAMIPGALVALGLCLLLDRDAEDAAVIAAWGAVGVGFGGQMTYGQTIGLAFDPPTRAWGVLGLTLKGAIWGFLGGAAIGLVLVRDQLERRRILFGLLAMVVATWIGWKLVNEPKLIYFSNRLDRPRPEIWMGLLLGACALLASVRDARVTRFAIWGLVGGGFGFGLGGWIQVWGRGNWPTPWIGWWKVMEFFFGFWFGAALGGCAMGLKEDLRGSAPTPHAIRWTHVAAGLGLLTLALYLGGRIPVRFGYTILGAALMAAALSLPGAAWQIAITMTYCAFSIDYLRSRPVDYASVLWVGVAATTLIVAFAVARTGRVWPLFVLLLWAANLNSYAKSFTNGWMWNGHTLVEIAFTLLGIAATWMAASLYRDRHRRAAGSGTG